MKIKVRGNISYSTGNNREGDHTLGINQNIQETNDVESTQQPIGDSATNMIHSAMHDAFNVLNLVLNWILVLVMQLRLTVFNSIHVENVFHDKGGFGLYII